jgi:hypothetical protein
MAGLFTLFTFAMLAGVARQRRLAIALFFTGLVLSLLMFWHHATDVLKINL